MEVTGQHFHGCWLLNASIHLYQSFHLLPFKNSWILWISFPQPYSRNSSLCSPSPNLSSKVYSRFSVSLFPLCINLSIHPKWNSFTNNSLNLFSSRTMNFALPWDSWLYLHRFSSRFQQSVTSSSLKHFHGARASFRFCWLLTILFSVFPLPFHCRLKFWIHHFAYHLSTFISKCTTLGVIYFPKVLNTT